MKQISLSQFKRMTAGQIRESPCVEVVADGDHLFIAIIGSEADMRTAMRGQASQINAARGKE